MAAILEAEMVKLVDALAPVLKAAYWAGIKDGIIAAAVIGLVLWMVAKR